MESDMLDGSSRSKGCRFLDENLSDRLSLMGNRSVSTPVTVITVSLRGGSVSRCCVGSESRCCACNMPVPAVPIKKAVSVRAILRIEVSFRTKGILLGRDSSDRLRCF